MYHFDWDTAPGSTVDEKYESLYQLVVKILYDDLAVRKGVVVSHNKIVSLFEVVHPGFQYTPVLLTVQNTSLEMEYAGRIVNKQKNLTFDFFRDAGFPDDKLIVFSMRGDKHGIIELKNI